MPPAVTLSPLTRRQARTGALLDQRRSTWGAIEQAVGERRQAAALELARFALDGECRFVYDLLVGWARDLRALLGEQGVAPAELERVEARLAAVLAYPDGAPYEPERGWALLSAEVDRLAEHVRAGRFEEAAAAVAVVREAWRVLHDRVVDASYGWMSAYVERHGEQAVPEMFRAIGREHFEEFLALADPAERAWEGEGRDAVLLDTLEAMRVHLSTRGRDGAPIQLVEHEDRWELSFDPCGSGGRAQLGDEVEGTPSRLEDPYRFGVIEGAYEWTDGRAGMCVYCNHCQQLYEQWTIDRAGFPFLVVEPPDRSGERPTSCRYTIYKTTDAVPDEIYRRCGRERPA